MNKKKAIITIIIALVTVFVISAVFILNNKVFENPKETIASQMSDSTKTETDNTSIVTDSSLKVTAASENTVTESISASSKQTAETTSITTETKSEPKEDKTEEAPILPTFSKQSIKTEQMTVNYWLYAPKNAKQNMPLIVYLHGGTGKGDNLDLVVNHDGFPKYLQDGTLGDIDAYVIIPQLPSGQKSWKNVSKSLMQTITAVSNKYGINKGNISLTGHSMGGSGTWEIALQYPKTFARIAPMSGSIKNTADNIAKLSDLSIWAVVGSEDKIVDPTSSAMFIDSLKSVNSNAKITVLEGMGHFDVPNAYLDKSMNIIDWLIGNF